MKRRVLERQVMAFKSNQPVSADKVEHIGNLAVVDPELFNELALKRTNTFKDPGNRQMPNPQLWSTYNTQAKKSIHQVITPKIIMKDQQACQAIL